MKQGLREKTALIFVIGKLAFSGDCLHQPEKMAYPDKKAPKAAISSTLTATDLRKDGVVHQPASSTRILHATDGFIGKAARAKLYSHTASP